MNRLESFRPGPVTVYALLTLTMAIVASSNVIGRAVHEVIPPIGLGFWRAVIPMFVLAPLVLPNLSNHTTFIRRHWKLLWLLGFLQFVPSAVMLLALNFTTAINATLITASQTVTTAIIAWLMINDRVTLRQGLGIAAGLCGILVMIARADIGVFLGLGINIGDMLVVVAIIGWGFYNILLLRLPLNVGTPTILFLISCTGSALLLPAYILETIYIRPVEFNTVTVTTVLALGFGVSTVAVFMWNTALRAIGPHRTNIFANLIPIFGAGLAIIFLGERLFLFHLAGAILVAIGIALVILGRRKPT